MTDKEVKLEPCPCGGKMEVLNDQRHLKQRVSRNKYELVCIKCGLTVKHPTKSTHKLITAWNTRPDPWIEITEELKEEIVAIKKSFKRYKKDAQAENKSLRRHISKCTIRRFSAIRCVCGLYRRR